MVVKSGIISDEWCHGSENYVGRDFVPYLDIVGLLKYGNQLHKLPHHPNAGLWEHGFMSSTFDNRKNDILDDFLKN